MAITSIDQLSPSKKLGAELIYIAFKILKENDRHLPKKELFKLIPPHLNLDSWATERYEKTGFIRWETILHFKSIPCMKSGFLYKTKGVWYLTPEGEEALKLGKLELHISSTEGYMKWKEDQPPGEKEGEDDPPGGGTSSGILIEDIQQQAKDKITQLIIDKNAYEFQDLCAGLLRGMGYFTPFVAPPGKDGGVDIIAYRDPMGTTSPRIKVQVKHRKNSSSSVGEVRQLMGLIQQDEVGIFISTGGFTSDGISMIRNSPIHIELIDLDRFIEMWQEFYPKMSDQDKNLLPLTSVYLPIPKE